MNKYHVIEMDAPILIANLTEVLKELNTIEVVTKHNDPLNMVASSIDIIRHLIQKTINDLKKDSK